MPLDSLEASLSTPLAVPLNFAPGTHSEGAVSRGRTITEVELHVGGQSSGDVLETDTFVHAWHGRRWTANPRRAAITLSRHVHAECGHALPVDLKQAGQLLPLIHRWMGPSSSEATASMTMSVMIMTPSGTQRMLRLPLGQPIDTRLLGSAIWPAAFVLGEELQATEWAHPLQNASVLELGAGAIGYPGLVMALRGGKR